jgi:hypothetical protein
MNTDERPEPPEPQLTAEVERFGSEDVLCVLLGGLT